MTPLNSVSHLLSEVACILTFCGSNTVPSQPSRMKCNDDGERLTAVCIRISEKGGPETATGERVAALRLFQV